MPILGSIIKSAVELKGLSLREERSKSEPAREQEKVLRKLLLKARDTSFGEYHGFQDILREKDITTAFRQRVPTHDYNSIFRKWWYRTLQGEPYV
ncbi:MAG: GH3 auxin-responsive promoter family protein, partial [Bacteroidales bacterium]|nr:GH3 auxin-responsive promoter family protein [Bacteroidales bacterium]